MLEEPDLYERVWGEAAPDLPLEERVLNIDFPPPEDTSDFDSSSGLESEIARLRFSISEIKSLLVRPGQGNLSRRLPISNGQSETLPFGIQTEITDGLVRLSDGLNAQMAKVQQEINDRLDQQQELILRFLKSMDSAAASLAKIAALPHRSGVGRDWH